MVAFDARTLRVTWSGPYLEADRLFGFGHTVPLPRHLLERSYQEEKDSFLQHPYWGDQFVGAGPFKVREVAPARHYLLEANEQYVLGRPSAPTGAHHGAGPPDDGGLHPGGPRRHRSFLPLLGQIVHHLTDRLVLMGLFHDPDPVLVGENLKQVMPGTLSNVHQWDLDSGFERCTR